MQKIVLGFGRLSLQRVLVRPALSNNDEPNRPVDSTTTKLVRCIVVEYSFVLCDVSCAVCCIFCMQCDVCFVCCDPCLAGHGVRQS